jgi:hypothetical protein
MFEEDVQNAFYIASKETKEYALTPVALLGQQVVAGTNYMFLCQAEKDGVKDFKAVIVYVNLEGKPLITNVVDFDVTKYMNKDISLNAETLSGGWQTSIPGKPFVIDEKVQAYYDEAIQKVIGVSYFPIKVLAHQEKDGDTYVILSYGRMADQNATEGVYVLTLFVDENDKPEIKSIAAVDLKEFNK